MIQRARYTIMDSVSVAADDLASFPPADWSSWVIFFLLELRRNHAGDFNSVWAETVEKVENLGWEYWRQLWESQLPELWEAERKM